MIGRIEDLADLRHLLSNQSFDAHLQCHIRGAATLTPTTHSYEYVVVLNIQQFDKPTVRSHPGIDHLVQDLLYPCSHVLRRQSLSFGNFRRWVQKGPDCGADSLS